MATRGGSETQRPKTDILLVTVREVEAKAVLNVFPAWDRSFIGDKTYYDLGSIGGARTAMVQSEMAGVLLSTGNPQAPASFPGELMGQHKYGMLLRGSIFSRIVGMRILTSVPKQN